MKIMWMRTTAAAATLALAACATPPTQEHTGMVVGGVLGGVLGSQVGGGSGRTTATIIGAIAGAAIGSAVGRSMDENDRRRTAQVLESSPTGRPTQWRNPDTGHQYTVTPTKTVASGGQPCREYTVDAVIGGKQDTVHGTACRQADGSWKAVN
jgi:surface antigen